MYDLQIVEDTEIDCQNSQFPALESSCQILQATC